MDSVMDLVVEVVVLELAVASIPLKTAATAMGMYKV
jgi:hypothetical protein